MPSSRCRCSDHMRNSRGFTLIEVVVAAVIFALTMLFGLAFFLYGQKNMASAYETTTMLQVAKSRLETEKTREYASIIAIAPTVVPKSAIIPFDYTIEQTVSAETTLPGPSTLAVPATNDVSSKLLGVTVSWTSNATGSNQSITLKTLVMH